MNNADWSMEYCWAADDIADMLGLEQNTIMDGGWMALEELLGEQVATNLITLRMSHRIVEKRNRERYERYV